MKALKILGIIFGTIALAAVVFYVGWLRAPAPEEVCENMFAVAKKETGVALPTQERESCIRRLQPPEFGRIPYVAQMKCMKNATSAAELKQCGKP